MIEVKRRKGESIEGFLRRFGRKVQQSGIVLEVKKRKFHGRAKSRNLRRVSALRRNEKRTEYAYLEKMGLLPEPKNKGRR